MMTYLIALCSVFALGIGQVLFKISANSLLQNGSFFNFKTLISFFLAAVIYAATSLAWIWILQKVELVKIYPLMALAFVFVPILSYYILDESLNIYTFYGAVVIGLGVWISVF
ncbi:EamA family transporter [bacterium]|nr:EamA family transporter [bacterium]